MCTDGRLKQQCLECLPLTEAIEKGFVCKVCVPTITGAGFCRSCSNSMGLTEEISMEPVVLACLCHFFGEGIKFNCRVKVWGMFVNKRLMALSACNEQKGLTSTYRSSLKIGLSWSRSMKTDTHSTISLVKWRGSIQLCTASRATRSKHGWSV